ncbi:arylsulfatase [Rhodohalobacter sp. 614A]|uniref:arylsulfatase n=1 Tax=Rhodohalobacter sp. 614A TaxID=2908649 RepID=UPI001F2509CD|nr:arylsulfatase [Rhodohalobacter sp. 614A]
MKIQHYKIPIVFILTFLIFFAGLSIAKSQNSKRPNIVYILLDDAGFSDLGSYGSEINTPNMDQLATEGIRYNHFETRAICSPTRAALLTGRNSQAVGMMDLAGGSEDGPAHSRGYVTPEAAIVAQILKENGYQTTATGKWHLTPPQEMFDESTNSASTRRNWPTGKGFDNFYGWLTGWTDQYNPSGRGQRIIEGDMPAEENNPGGEHVSEEIVTKAIQYLDEGFKTNPEQPQFLYLAFGAIHAPIQVPEEYIEKYNGAYDEGWDKIRLERFERQKRIGIIPEDAVLTARHLDDPAWNSLSDEEKAVFARFMEVYAGFTEHTDEQIGRLINYLKSSGQYDNTVIFLMSDNGAAPEAGVEGNFEHPYGGQMTISEMYNRLDELGSENSSALYQRPWARVGATPFQKYKLWPHGGGVRDPLIITWPEKIRDSGSIRTQYVETIDITPTVLDILDIGAPEELDGVEQMDFHGESILPTFTDPNASTRTTQFYLMRGNRAIYHDGWKAIAIHERGTDFEDDHWELYHVEKDFSEAVDLSAQYPEKVEEMKALWWTEAEKYGGLPLLEFRPPWLRNNNDDDDDD